MGIALLFFFWERPLKKNGGFSSRLFFRHYFCFWCAHFFFKGRFWPLFCNFFTFFCNYLGDEGRFLASFVGAYQAPIFFEQAPFFLMGAFLCPHQAAFFFSPFFLISLVPHWRKQPPTSAFVYQQISRKTNTLFLTGSLAHLC